MEKGKRAGRGVRLVALLLALCLAACLPSALAEEYAEPNTADGWVYKENSDEWWLVSGSDEDPKHIAYELPFKSEKGIFLNANASMTAPSIEVTGKVETSGSGKIVCAGLLSATGKVSSGGTITAGSLECGEIHVGSYLVVRDRISCRGQVEIEKDGMLVLPGNTTQEEVQDLKTTGEGLILVGTKAYDTNGDLRKGASIYLTDGIDVSDGGFNWNSETCTLTLTGFKRDYVSGNINMAGIVIDVPGKAVTLVLNGENKLTELGGGCRDCGSGRRPDPDGRRLAELQRFGCRAGSVRRRDSAKGLRAAGREEDLYCL